MTTILNAQVIVDHRHDFIMCYWIRTRADVRRLLGMLMCAGCIVANIIFEAQQTNLCIRKLFIHIYYAVACCNVSVFGLPSIKSVWLVSQCRLHEIGLFGNFQKIHTQGSNRWQSAPYVYYIEFSFCSVYIYFLFFVIDIFCILLVCRWRRTNQPTAAYCCVFFFLIDWSSLSVRKTVSSLFYFVSLLHIIIAAIATRKQALINGLDFPIGQTTIWRLPMSLF